MRTFCRLVFFGVALSSGFPCFADRTLEVPPIRIYNAHPTAPTGSSAGFYGGGTLHLQNLSPTPSPVTVSVAGTLTVQTNNGNLPNTLQSFTIPAKTVTLQPRGQAGERGETVIKVYCPWSSGSTNCSLTPGGTGTLSTPYGVDVTVMYYLTVTVTGNRGAVVGSFSGDSSIVGGYLTTQSESPTVALNGGRPF